MSILRTFFILLASLFAAVGCGPLAQGTVAGQVVDTVKTRTAGAAPAPQTQLAVSQEEILSSSGKYMRVNIRNKDSWDTMVQVAVNGTRSTWIDNRNISVTVEDGIVLATRGLSRDLMAANVAETRAALRAGGGDAKRTHEFITNLDGISAKVLQCRIVSKGPDMVERLQTRQNTDRFEENCQGAGLEFTNIYWVNRAGEVVRSLQAVSPEAGYLQIDVF